MQEERLQKYMARCGVASRRKCEELIAEGAVELNDEVVREPGVKIDPARDRIKVNGKALRQERPAYYLHYKVKGVTTTVSDELGRKTIMDCLPDIRERVYPVGRLDKESEGLIVLTNDGELANYLTHPAHGVEKTYRVVAEGRVPEDTLRALAEKGIRLGPVLIRPTRVELDKYDNDNTVVFISVSEGITREVRRIFAALGHEVKKLLRVQVGPMILAGLKRGATRPMSPKELKLLKKGMSGMVAESETDMFPAGTAKERRPTGPRGRPRREKVPRQGKPDPAAHVPAAKAAKKPGTRGKVVVDDWKKTVKTGSQVRRGRSAAAEPTAEKKPLRALRPVKAAASKPPESPKPAAKPTPARPVKLAAHPFAPKPVKEAPKPARGAPRPAKGAFKPNKGTPKPSREPRPAKGAFKPDRGTPKPAREASRPGKGTPKPARGAAKPVSRRTSVKKTGPVAGRKGSKNNRHG